MIEVVYHASGTPLGGEMGTRRRIVRIVVGGEPRWGIERGGAVIDLPEGPYGDSPVEGDTLAWLEESQVLAPTLPTKVIGIGRNYAAHAAEHGVEIPSEPLFFLKPPSSVLAPGAAVELPALSERVEHEAELAVVMGRRCRRVQPDDAWSHVLGITCGNDVTARDLQRADAQWTRGKGFDTFCPLGPWIVACHHAEEVSRLTVRCRVNGELRQQGRCDQMVFSIAELIARISVIMTLEPGDVILTGTPAGVGPLVAGDIVEVEVDGVGVLGNPVVGGCSPLQS
jgi:2-keto-4-pentenoate hydratase/2-oxohepta-3-ene-1,7-dioic acid hydratase in catechol pathway